MLIPSFVSAIILASSLSLVASKPTGTGSSGATSTASSPNASSSSGGSSGSGGGSFNGRFTYYNPSVGTGSCGKQNSDESFTVALNVEQYGSGYPGPHCFKDITVSYNGKSHDATIMDMCPTCPYGALDLSPALFEYFAPLTVGVIYGEWSYKDGSSSSNSSSNSTSSGTGSGPSSTTPASSSPSVGSSSTSSHHSCLSCVCPTHSS